MTHLKNTLDALANPLLFTAAILLAIDHWGHFGIDDLLLLAILTGIGFRTGRKYSWCWLCVYRYEADGGL